MDESRFIGAAKDGYTDILREATKKDLNTSDEDGMTATLWAAKKGNLEALRLIVGRGGDVNKSDYLGYTALHHAAISGHLDVVSFLVHWGCNLFALENDSHTALDLAGIKNHEAIVRFLDGAASEQTTKNPRNVAKLREQAVVAMEKNIKRYEQKLEETKRRLEKQNSQNNDFHAPSKKSMLKSLTGKFRSGGTAKAKQAQLFSHYTGASQKTDQRKGSTGPQVTYRSDDNTITRPALDGVFPQGSHMPKAKSEGDIISSRDSGNDSYLSDQEDTDDEPGMFNRPGWGKTVFTNRLNHLIDTIPHFGTEEMEQNGNGKDVEDEFSRSTNGLSGHDEGFHRENMVMRGGIEVPWDDTMIEALDDDEEETEFSALETFLSAAGLASCISYFTRERVDLNQLMSFDEKNLRDIGIPYGPIVKVLAALQHRRDALQNPKQMTDSYL